MLPRIRNEKNHSANNHKQTKEEAALGVSNEELIYGRGGKKPIVVTEVPAEFTETLKKEQEEAK